MDDDRNWLEARDALLAAIESMKCGNRPQMQSVSVYLRDDSYFTVVIHGSGGGDPCIASGPVLTLSANTDARSLGAAILEALGQSTSTASWPKDWKKVTEPLLAGANVKTWSAFAKRATNARVDRTDQTVSVRPSQRDKSSFVDLPDKVIHLVAPDVTSLGSVVATSLGGRIT